MSLPLKEKLIKKVKRDKFFQSVFNIVTIMALLNIIYITYIQYEMNLLTAGSSLLTFVILGIIYFYAKYLNNRISLNLNMTYDTINHYDEIKQVIEALIHDKLNNAGKKQNPEN
jgi:hypothetical protein